VAAIIDCRSIGTSVRTQISHRYTSICWHIHWHLDDTTKIV